MSNNTLSTCASKSHYFSSPNLFLPPECQDDVIMMRKGETSPHAASSRPITINLNAMTEQIEEEIAREMDHMEIKALEMLSLMTGASSEQLLTRESDMTEPESFSDDGCFKMDLQYDLHTPSSQAKLTKYSPWESYSLPENLSKFSESKENSNRISGINYQLQPNEYDLSLIEAEDFEYLGYDEMKGVEDEEEFIFELEL